MPAISPSAAWTMSFSKSGKSCRSGWVTAIGRLAGKQLHAAGVCA